VVSTNYAARRAEHFKMHLGDHIPDVCYGVTPAGITATINKASKVSVAQHKNQQVHEHESLTHWHYGLKALASFITDAHSLSTTYCHYLLIFICHRLFSITSISI
jgi:hypothetical protein